MALRYGHMDFIFIIGYMGEQIEAYLDAHKEEMLADICRLIRINSTKGEAVIDCPFGEGPAKARGEELAMGEG